MQLEDLKNDRIEMQKFQAELVANGGNPDLKVLAQTMLRSPKTRGEGIELMQKLNQQAQFETVGKKLYPELFGAEPTAAAPTVAPAPSIMRQPGVAPVAPIQDALGTGTYGMAPTAPMNAMAPAPTAPVNALAAPTAPAGKTVADLRREIMLFSQSTDPRAKAMVDVLKGQLTEMTKTNVVGGRLVSGAGKVLYTAPPETSDIKEYEYAVKNQGYTGSFTDFVRIKPTAGAARQVTNVNTQIPASEEAQKEFMKEARVTFNTLKSAPSVLANMEEAKKLVPSAKGFMGPGGEPLLKVASFLNNRLGTNIATEGVEDAVVLRSRLFTGVIENLRKLDAQPTQAQQQVLQDAIGNLGTDPNALPRVLDAFGDILRQKVGAYNAEVTDAESRGVKFPYNPVIKMPEVKVPAASQIPGQGTTGVSVTLPDGRVKSFPNAEAANQFKKAAGIK
jgi:hypothetical protein